MDIDENTTIKDFMEWYAKEYDNAYLLPSDYEYTINTLNGYKMAKGECEEANMLLSSVNLLRSAKNFFDVVMRYAKWKYRP